MQNNREILKAILINANTKNSPLLPTTTIFNNCMGEAYSEIITKYGGNQELLFLFFSLDYFLTEKIRKFVLEIFTDCMLDQVLDNMAQASKDNFDNWFMEMIKYKKENNYWINPIENRLNEVLLGKTDH